MRLVVPRCLIASAYSCQIRGYPQQIENINEEFGVSETKTVLSVYDFQLV